jgi:ABC-type lipoprotein export system ATPase subunit
MLDLLLGLNKRFGTAVLLATHDERIAAAADRVIQMRDGALVSADSAKPGGEHVTSRGGR